MLRLKTAIGVMLALLCIVASMAMNGMFLLAQGKTPTEGYILATLSVAVDGFKALLPFWIAAAWVAGRRAYGMLASAVFVLLFGFSLLSALGFASSNRGAVVGGRDAVSARAVLAARELTEAETRLAALPAARLSGVIEADLQAARVDRLWSSSKGCEDATVAASRDFCKGVAALRAELATSIDRVRLTEQQRHARRDIQAANEQGAGLESDPQAGLLSRLSGAAVGQVQTALMVLIAVLVEVLAAFGLYLATAHGAVAKKRADDDAAGASVILLRPDLQKVLPIAGPKRVRLG